MKMDKNALGKMAMPKAGGSKDDMFDMEATEKEFGDQPAEDVTADMEPSKGPSKEFAQFDDEALLHELKARGYDVEHELEQEEASESPEEEAQEKKDKPEEEAREEEEAKMPKAKSKAKPY